MNGDWDGYFVTSWLFHGVPSFPEAKAPIVLSAQGGTPAKLSIRVCWLMDETGADGTAHRYVVASEDQAQDSGFVGTPGMEVDFEDGRRLVPLDAFPRQFRFGGSNRRQVPCEYFGCYSGGTTEPMVRLWDKIALTDQEKDVVTALQIIEPGISAVTMVSDERSRRGRIAEVRVSGMDKRVPLRSFGDGLSRLFGITLALVNAKGGVLLIDEIENGIHHTVQLDLWKIIFQMARKLNVQVFATSHSWDAVEAFQRAAAGTPDDGVLVRLTRKGECVRATVFAEQELAIATRDRIEVR